MPCICTCTGTRWRNGRFHQRCWYPVDDAGGCLASGHRACKCAGMHVVVTCSIIVSGNVSLLIAMHARCRPIVGVSFEVVVQCGITG